MQKQKQMPMGIVSGVMNLTVTKYFTLKKFIEDKKEMFSRMKVDEENFSFRREVLMLSFVLRAFLRNL